MIDRVQRMAACFFLGLCLWPMPAMADEAFLINAGLSGTWYNPETAGQGFFIDVDPSRKILFIGWFTHGEPNPQTPSLVGTSYSRWFVAQGGYSDEAAQATLDLFETEGGVFIDPAPVTTHTVGSLSVSFQNCTQAVVEFSFDDGRAQGLIELSRLTPADVCEASSALTAR